MAAAVHPDAPAPPGAPRLVLCGAQLDDAWTADLLRDVKHTARQIVGTVRSFGPDERAAVREAVRGAIGCNMRGHSSERREKSAPPRHGRMCREEAAGREEGAAPAAPPSPDMRRLV